MPLVIQGAEEIAKDCRLGRFSGSAGHDLFFGREGFQTRFKGGCETGVRIGLGKKDVGSGGCNVREWSRDRHRVDRDALPGVGPPAWFRFRVAGGHLPFAVASPRRGVAG